MKESVSPATSRSRSLQKGHSEQVAGLKETSKENNSSRREAWSPLGWEKGHALSGCLGIRVWIPPALREVIQSPYHSTYHLLLAWPPSSTHASTLWPQVEVPRLV